MKWLEWAGVAIGSVLLTAVALYGMSRWLGPSAEQERALALMSGGIVPDRRDPFAPSYDIEAIGRQANLDFDQGSRHAAFDRVCGEVVAQRRVGAEARDLVGYMGAARVVDASSRLFAELLARRRNGPILLAPPRSVTMAGPLAPAPFIGRLRVGRLQLPSDDA